MQWTKEKVRKVADQLFEDARAIWLDGDEVEAMIFLFIATPGEEKPQIAIVKDLRSKNKEEHRQLIREAVLVTGAQFVARVDEAWVVAGTDLAGQEALKRWLGSGKGLKDYPGRKEVIQMIVDGGGLQLLYQGEIKDDGTLGETEISDAFSAADGSVHNGTFTNLSERVFQN